LIPLVGEIQIMASQVNPLEKGHKRAQTLTLGLRFLLFLLVCGVQMIYGPTSNRLTGGIEPKLPIDIFPLWTVWVIPYVLCYPLWLVGIAWAMIKMEHRLFRSFIVASLVTCSISMLIFITFPTYVPAATFTETDIFTYMLRYIHENAGRYDAFPSGHIYITVLLALFYNRWYPRYKFYWIGIPVIVAFSTLFTYQHYIVDIFGGWIVALIGFHVGLRWAGFAPLRGRAVKTRLLEPPS
jgi:membrane-associated phospholipid phosphatase